MTKKQEDKIANLVHSIALTTGIANEQMVRKAALKVASDYGISDQVMMLETLHLFLADGQERRFIVTKFRENIEELDRKAWEEDEKDMQQINREWQEYRNEDRH